MENQTPKIELTNALDSGDFENLKELINETM
jgi:hypothetical protein